MDLSADGATDNTVILNNLFVESAATGHPVTLPHTTIWRDNRIGD